MTVSISKMAGRRFVFAVAMFAGLAMPGLVNAEGTNDIGQRLDMLEFQAGQLSQSLDAMGTGFNLSLTPPAEIGGDVVLVAQSRDVAQLNLRLSTLEEQIRILTGQVEGLQFQMTQYQTLLEHMQEDIDFRFEQIDPSLGN